MQAIRLVVVDDHQIVREGLRSLMQTQPDMVIVGEAADGRAALEVVQEQQPDVVLIDLTLPGLGGVEVIEQLQKLTLARPIVLSMHDHALAAQRAMRAGAKGFVVKGRGIDKLCEAIRTVHRGGVYLSPEIAGHLVEALLRPEGEGELPLTLREREVLALVAEGLTSRQIAARLELKAKTIDNHRARIMDKLDIHTVAGLVRYAIDNEIVG